MKWRWLMLLPLLVILVGCTTQQEVVTEDPPGSGIMRTNTEAVVDPRVDDVVDKVNKVHDSLDPLNPYSEFTKPIIGGLGGVVVALSGLLARLQNRKKRVDTALNVVVRAVEKADDGDVKSNVASISSKTGVTTTVKEEITRIKSKL